MTDAPELKMLADWSDKPDELSDEIRADYLSDGFWDRYTKALLLVSNRHSKRSLVSLVAYLLKPSADLAKPRVKPLVWENDTAWVDIGAKFKGSYSITQLEYDLAEVSFGVLCHEFGDEVIWRGPKEEAKAHANAHNEARVLACLEGYGESLHKS